MKDILLRWLVMFLGLLAASYFLDGVTVETWAAMALGSFVLGVLNALARPILLILTLPITLLTFGLFIVVINGGMVWVAAHYVPGFIVDSFAWAMGAGLVVSFVSVFLRGIEDDD